MKIFARPLALLGLLFLTQGLAIASGLYDVERWFDIPMHFSGGFAIGLLALAVWDTYIQGINFKPQTGSIVRRIAFIFCILGVVALVGIAWEWYEFIFDAAVRHLSAEFRPTQVGLGDTMADLFLDLLGGLTAVLISRKR